ncbi:MAG: helix-turn-helix transcriptional regulator [Muribaculaceae bacterium]|nr:helix-turn-helix transcriptional regulator [Muribaculaceae bacterium]MDE6194616.1 helix-turn-helix transcriptional regulator [Muribaculaceae bacterium]MDE6856191.1 helix-turn-helix transcriptional regulator [Muribaculaceae bacterium]
MKRMKTSLRDLFEEIPKEKREAARLSFAVSDRLAFLMESKGMSKKQLADNLGKRPNEITRWLSGEHNFTLSTIAKLSTYFGEPIIHIP